MTPLYSLDLNEILPLLIRTRICEIKHRGFFHKLAEIGVSLIDPIENSVNVEIGIKRMFY